MTKAAKRVLFGGVSLLMAFTGFVGFAHTSAGRPLLAWLSGAPGCPVSLEGGDARTVEAHRISHLKRELGSAAAGAHPALGFELGRTHRDQVWSWARNSGALCKTLREASVLRCTGFAHAHSRSLPLDDAHLQFDANGMLVAADVYRVRTSAERALSFLREQASLLDARVGPRTKDDLHQAPDELATQRFHRVAVDYQYRQYVAELSAINLGERGIRVRERYAYMPSSALALNDRVP